MPKRVDRQVRRLEIVDAYLRTVSRAGVAPATSRDLAAEAGIAVGALWHYFDGFDDVVRAAFQRVFAESDRRIEAATAGARGLDALWRMSTEVMPHDAQTRAEAVVVARFWGLVPSHDDFRSLSLSVEREWSGRIARHLAEAVADGDLRAETPVAALADLVLALFDVAQLREVQGSALADSARHDALLAQLLDPWRAPAG